MSRRRKLSPEEEALWRKATRDVARYASHQQAKESIVSDSKAVSAAPPKRPGGTAVPLKTPCGGGPAKPADLFSSGDPRLDRLAGRGRLEIDAVLDLHGHRQETARTTLHRFVSAGYARGARCLLVITGKGGPENPQGGAPSIGRGVLRSRFRDWISEEAVRGFVSRAARAHQRHGGDGAFYVFLKR